MRKQSEKPQHSDNLELYFLRFMGEPLGQGVQAKKQNSETQNAEQQHYRHYYHEHIGFTGSGDERRQMVRRSRVERLCHSVTPIKTNSSLHRS
jgi:hypothetical protein